MGAVCTGEDRPQHKTGAAGDAGVKNDGGLYELSQDHAEYAQKTAAKTAQKSKEIASQYSAAQSGSEQIKSVSRYWFEFHNKLSERVEEVRKFDKQKEDVPDQKEAHDKFLKELNFILEEPLIKIYRAYSEEQDNGDRKIDKEVSLRLFDDLVVGQEKMAIASFQEYATYMCKLAALGNDDLKKKRDDAADDAGKAAIKAARQSALDEELAKSKFADDSSLAAFEKVIAAAKEQEIETEEATKKLEEAKEKKAEVDKKAAEKNAEKEAKAKETEDRKVEKMKAEEKEKYEKDKAAEKEKKEKADAAEKEKKEAAEATLSKAVEAAGEDLPALQKAVDAANKDKAKPDTKEAEAKLSQLKADAADKVRTETARESADEGFVVQLQSNIDQLVKDWTAEYNSNTLSKRKAGFEKFFGGKNGSSEADFALDREDMKKVLTIGAGDFEGFVSGLGFKVTDADALEAVKASVEEAVEAVKASVEASVEEKKATPAEEKEQRSADPPKSDAKAEAEPKTKAKGKKGKK